jgi:toxin YoeB
LSSVFVGSKRPGESVFSENAWDDYLYWQKSDRKIVQRINALIKDVQRTPFEGVGKPEPLKHALSGYWSRRITDELRLDYKVAEDAIQIAQLRYHL